MATKSPSASCNAEPQRHSGAANRLQLEGEVLQEQLLRLVLTHPHVGISVIDQRSQRSVLELPMVLPFLDPVSYCLCPIACLHM